MMEAANRKDDDFAFAKGTQVQENDDLVMVGAEAVKVITPIEMADEEQAANAVAVKGEVQPNEFRDSWAAVLFLIQFMGVVSVAIAYAPYISSQSDKDSSYFASEINDDDADDISGASIFLLFFISYGIAGFTTMGALSLMMRYSESLVKISFFFAPLSFAAVALLLLLAGDDTSMIFAIVALFMSVLMVCCWFFYKKHIPFAAANLRSALTALRLNSATYGFAFIFSLVSFVTMLIGLIAIAGVQAKADSEGKVLCSTLVDDDTVFVGEQAGVECDKNPPNPILLMTLFLCFYWTQQVVQNVVHVTTAGVVGSWWFTPMADPSCCSPTIISSLRRALTYSFGSICFGSLLVAMMQLLEQLARNARQNGRGGILLCVVQCIIQCLRGYMEYFNSWAFVYVGLYGYPYIEAGKNVINLFRQRGWTTLIADRLVFRVLLFCNLGIGALCGTLAIICDFAIGPFFPDKEASHIFSFLVAFFIGLFISNVTLFVVESAVRTVIVCFAESPAEFDEHHPVLSENMKAGWAEAYPTVVGVLT